MTGIIGSLSLVYTFHPLQSAVRPRHQALVATAETYTLSFATLYKRRHHFLSQHSVVSVYSS